MISSYSSVSDACSAGLEKINEDSDEALDESINGNRKQQTIRLSNGGVIILPYLCNREVKRKLSPENRKTFHTICDLHDELFHLSSDEDLLDTLRDLWEVLESNDSYKIVVFRKLFNKLQRLNALIQNDQNLPARFKLGAPKEMENN